MIGELRGLVFSLSTRNNRVLIQDHRHAHNYGAFFELGYGQPPLLRTQSLVNISSFFLLLSCCKLLAFFTLLGKQNGMNLDK